MGCGNAFALPPPIPNQGPLTRGPFSYHPLSPCGTLTSVRVDTRGLLPCVRALCATSASRGPSVALPRGLSATSHPRGGPTCHVSSSAGRARHVITCRQVYSLFRNFLIKKILQNSFKTKIKIRKRHKIQKFITLNVELLFNPNFLHWITNSFIFNIMP